MTFGRIFVAMYRGIHPGHRLEPFVGGRITLFLSRASLRADKVFRLRNLILFIVCTDSFQDLLIQWTFECDFASALTPLSYCLLLLTISELPLALG